MIVSIIGLGYIGLPTAAILASQGVEVVGVDTSQDVVDIINQGGIHIVEPGLEALVRKSVQDNLLKAVKTPEKSDVFVVAVPTPFKDEYSPDLSYIKSAAKAIAPLLERGNLVILESTSPVGTTEKMMEWMKIERPDLSFPEHGNRNSSHDIAIAHCPERVLPGRVIHELVENDRVIGGITVDCANKALNLYKTFVKAECLITECRTAELSKLVENSFRDVNIAFANELSLICDKLNIDVWELIRLANRHPRVDILQPGPGVGGHCIAVDPWFIVNSAPEESKLIQVARRVNDKKPDFVLGKIVRAVDSIGKERSDLVVACLGLTFKPDIDDLRESPALEIVQKISTMGFGKVLIVEPNIDKMPDSLEIETIMLSADEAIKMADIVVLLVDHKQFKEIDKEDLLQGKHVVDTRGIWS